VAVPILPLILAPIVGGLAGFTKTKGMIAFRERERAERELADVILKAHEAGNVPLLTHPEFRKSGEKRFGKEVYEGIVRSAELKSALNEGLMRALLGPETTQIVRGPSAPGAPAPTTAGPPGAAAAPFFGSTFAEVVGRLGQQPTSAMATAPTSPSAEAISAMAGQLIRPQPIPRGVEVPEFRPGVPVAEPPQVVREEMPGGAPRFHPDPLLAPIFEGPPAEPAAAPAPAPATAPAPQVDYEGIVNRLVQSAQPGGMRLPEGTSATFRLGDKISVTKTAPTPEQRGLRIMSEASRLNAPVPAVIDALERAQANVPEARFNVFVNRRVLADFEDVKRGLKDQITNPQQLDREAAREVVRRQGVLGPLSPDLVFANKDEADQTTMTFLRNQLGKGRTPMQAIDLAPRVGFRLSPEVRKGFEQEAFTAAFQGGLQRRAGQGMPVEQATREAAQEAAALAPGGVPPQLAKQAFPELPGLPADIEAQLQLQGKTAATATPGQKQAAERAAASREEELAGRAAMQRQAVEQGVPRPAPGGVGVVPKRPEATERKTFGEIDARITSAENLLQRAESPEVQAILGPGLTRPFAAGRRALGAYIPEALTTVQRQFLADLSRETSALKTELIGAARTKPELADLIPLIPEPHDLPEAVVPKLRAFVNGLRRERKTIGEALGGVGVQVPPEPTAPPPKGKLIKRPDGSFEYVPGGTK